mmetsp:Transcript_1677/g.2397  ORF Transcript_1677/g.2397 Transcript_1677/m.2397 type:complete len:287 (-) Transcript_1677:35-895(-)
MKPLGRLSLSLHTLTSKNSTINSPKSNHKNSFLQNLNVDDVILKIFEYLECKSLTRISATCHRFRELSHISALLQTQDMVHNLLGSIYTYPMKLLRSKEHICGIDSQRHPFVAVPLLGLPRPILVEQAGDNDYNGVYICTDFDHNGYVFTKPRYANRTLQNNTNNASFISNDASETTNTYISTLTNPRNHSLETRDQNGILKCFISKKFSNETILWYMSKEIVNQHGQIEQKYTFWSNLMLREDASPHISQYPSQTSVLSRNGDPAWQSLAHTTGLVRPPIVEFLY